MRATTSDRPTLSSADKTAASTQQTASAPAVASRFSSTLVWSTPGLTCLGCTGAQELQQGLCCHGRSPQVKKSREVEQTQRARQASYLHLSRKSGRLTDSTRADCRQVASRPSGRPTACPRGTRGQPPDQLQWHVDLVDFQRIKVPESSDSDAVSITVPE